MSPAVDLITVDPRAIDPSPSDSERHFREESLDLLRTSIQDVGVLSPLVVGRSADHQRFVLVDGRRRWRCSLDLGLAAVPVEVVDDLNLGSLEEGR